MSRPVGSAWSRCACAPTDHGHEAVIQQRLEIINDLLGKQDLAGTL